MNIFVKLLFEPIKIFMIIFDHVLRCSIDEFQTPQFLFGSSTYMQICATLPAFRNVITKANVSDIRRTIRVLFLFHMSLFLKCS